MLRESLIKHNFKRFSTNGLHEPMLKGQKENSAQTKVTTILSRLQAGTALQGHVGQSAYSIEGALSPTGINLTLSHSNGF